MYLSSKFLSHETFILLKIHHIPLEKLQGHFALNALVRTCVPNSHSQDVLDMEYARRRALNA